MSLTREQKEQSVQQAQNDIQSAISVVFVAFDGLTVDEANELRAKLFTEKSNMRVIPKRLLRVALQQSKIEFDPGSHEGQMAIVWGNDAVAPAKTLHTFSAKHPHVRITSGLLNGQLLAQAEVVALAMLPSRHQLQGMFVGVIAAPLRNFQSVLNGVQRQLVYALQALAEQKQATVN